jgi:hypothetical protein
MPATVRDRRGELAIGHHGLDVEILDSERLVLAVCYQCMTEFVMKILALVNTSANYEKLKEG